jgi:outer membrane protein TolC
MTRLVLVSTLLLCSAVSAAAQPAALPLTSRGVPATDVASAATIALSLEDAVRRGLEHNLAAILQEQQLRRTESTRLLALSEVLPHISASVSESEQRLSTAAFGFTGFPGIPSVLGPFRVFDARLALSTPLFDARAIQGLRAGSALTRAGRADYEEIRETVILAVGTLYLQAGADAARVAAAQAQVATADAFVTLADDQRSAGLVAGIDVLRQQVELQAARARLIAAENALSKRRLSLARAIGLPAGQPFVLTDTTTFTPAPLLSPEDATLEALAHRPDLRSARARVEAAQAARRAEAAAALPSVHLEANVGLLGATTATVDRTYGVAAIVHMPLFEGGRVRAHVRAANAELEARKAELADLSAGVRFEVEMALLDINATAAGVQVAQDAEALSRQALDQAQDRFRAGVASTIELVQAQDALAAASEQIISSVYAHNTAKAALARALGEVETRFVALIGGQHE